MRQAAFTSKNRIKHWLNPLLLLLLLLLLLGSAILYDISRPEPAVEPTPEEIQMITAKIAAAAQNKRFSLKIEESGPGYNLTFNGQIYENKLYGKIDAYNIEVFSAAGKYYIKENSAEEWEEVATAELDALPIFIRDPHWLLDALLSDKKFFVEVGEQRKINDILCQIYLLEIPTPKLQFLSRFEKEATLDKLQLYLWLAAEGEFLHRMALLMTVTVDGEQIQINRVYNLQEDDSALPTGLPQVESIVKPI